MRLSRTFAGLLERRAVRSAGSPEPRPALRVRTGESELAAYLATLDSLAEGMATPVYGMPVVPPPSAQLSHPEPDILARYRHSR